MEPAEDGELVDAPPPSSSVSGGGHRHRQPQQQQQQQQQHLPSAQQLQAELHAAHANLHEAQQRNRELASERNRFQSASRDKDGLLRLRDTLTAENGKLQVELRIRDEQIGALKREAAVAAQMAASAAGERDRATEQAQRHQREGEDAQRQLQRSYDALSTAQTRVHGLVQPAQGGAPHELLQRAGELEKLVREKDVTLGQLASELSTSRSTIALTEQAIKQVKSWGEGLVREQEAKSAAIRQLEAQLVQARSAASAQGPSDPRKRPHTESPPQPSQPASWQQREVCTPHAAGCLPEVVMLENRAERHVLGRATVASRASSDVALPSELAIDIFYTGSALIHAVLVVLCPEGPQFVLTPVKREAAGDDPLLAVHKFCLDGSRVIVNHCPDGRSVFLVPSSDSSSNLQFLAYTCQNSVFEESRTMLVKKRKLPLVLDLDHTLLVYREEDRTIVGRPGLEQFLRSMSRIFELHVYTQAAKEIAERYVRFLNSDNEDEATNFINFRQVHVAERCWDGENQREFVMCKDLGEVIGDKFGRQMAIILDDQYDGPDKGRYAKQLRDPKNLRKVISNGTWGMEDKANIYPVSRFFDSGERRNHEDQELRRIAQAFTDAHGGFFARFDALCDVLKRGLPPAELESALGQTPRTDVRDVLLERLQSFRKHAFDEAAAPSASRSRTRSRSRSRSRTPRA